MSDKQKESSNNMTIIIAGVITTILTILGSMAVAFINKPDPGSVLLTQNAIDHSNTIIARTEIFLDATLRAELTLAALSTITDTPTKVLDDTPSPTATLTDTPIPIPQTPIITIDNYQEFHVSGSVSPSDFCNQNYKVLLYAWVEGNALDWNVQPQLRSIIRINQNCIWQSDTLNWERMVAFLVPVDYQERAVVIGSVCPPLLEAVPSSIPLAYNCIDK